MTERIDPAASLLEHAGFLRRLAVQLAGRDAEDLAQDTWTVALARPPRASDSPRGWLAAVAGNLWKNQRRSAARRAARERAAARADCVPGVDEIAAREEVRRRVVEAVLALPDDLREVVVLRFYEGLDSPAIGARLGRPASTVRTRLQTALQHLRQRLDGEHGGRRAAWAVPLVAWRRFLGDPPLEGGSRPADLHPEGFQGALEGGAGAALGARLLAAALLGTGVAVWLAWPAAPGLAPESERAVAARAGAASGGARPDAADPPRAPAPGVAWIAAADATELRGDLPTASLAGRVWHAESARPLAAARVTLNALPAASSAVAPIADPRRVARAAVTDAGGNFAFADLPAGLYEVTAEEGGLAARARTVLAGGTGHVELFASAQPFRGLVAVRVLDAQGCGVAGAEVTVLAHCTRFGAVGWQGVPPIRGATDATGRFVHRDTARLEHLFEGLVLARAADGRLGSAVIARPEHRGDDPCVEVRLGPPAGIDGRLVGPVADWSAARVIAQPLLVYDHALPEAADGARAVAVAADGTFSIDGLPAGRWHLQVEGLQANGSADLIRVPARPVESWQFLPAVRLAAGERQETTIAFARAGRVSGTVRDGDGRPIAGARVTADRASGTESVYHHRLGEAAPASPYTHATASTDAAGQYRLALRPGTWHVAVTASGRSFDVRTGVVVAADAAGRDLEHRLVPDGGLRARTAGGAVALRAAAAPDLVHVLWAGDGLLALRGLAPGAWEVGFCEADGSFRTLASVTIVAGESRWLDLVGLGGGPVRGVVRIDGRPAAGIEVQVGSDGPRALTAADGSFALASGAALLAGGRELCFAHRGARLAGCAGATAAERGVFDLAARRLCLCAVDEGGAPVPATLWLTGVALGGGRQARWFLEGGRLAGQWAPPGPLQAHARFADGSEVAVPLGAGDVEVELRRAPAGSVEVRLLDADGHPRMAASLHLLPWGRAEPAPADGAAFFAARAPGQRGFLARTDVEGRARLEGVPPGPVLIWCSDRWGRQGYGSGADGPPRAEQVTRVHAGRTTPVELVLR